MSVLQLLPGADYKESEGLYCGCARPSEVVLSCLGVSQLVSYAQIGAQVMQ